MKNLYYVITESPNYGTYTSLSTDPKLYEHIRDVTIDTDEKITGQGKFEVAVPGDCIVLKGDIRKNYSEANG
jgi:hypothetical protein